MDLAKLNAVFAEMRPEDAEDLLKGVGLFVRAGTMDLCQAREWKRRVLARDAEYCELFGPLYL